MLLGSCTGVQPKIENKLFQEDTLVHEEIFGSVEEGLMKARKNAIDPNVPTIGIQTKESGGNISIRFIAAVKLGDLASTSAVWTRAMYDNSGNPFAVKGKTTAEIECTKAYTSVYNNNLVYDMSAFDAEHGIVAPATSGYTHFVVYTLLNIPKETYKNYSIKAFLTLNGDSTNYVATTVDASRQVSFPRSKNVSFLTGTFGGEQDIIDADNPTKGDHPENNFASFTHTFVKGDTFYFVRNDTTNNKFEILGSSVLTGEWNPIGQAFSNYGGAIKNDFGGDYILYFTDARELWATFPEYTLYLNDVKQDVPNVIPSGWVNKQAVFEAYATEGSTMKVYLGNDLKNVCEGTVPGTGYYRFGLDTDNTAWIGDWLCNKPYHLIGAFGGESWSDHEEYRFIVDNSYGQYRLATPVRLSVGDQFKVYNGGTYFPDGMDNNYVVDADHAGLCQIYFRSDGKGGDDWHYHYFYVQKIAD